MLEIYNILLFYDDRFLYAGNTFEGGFFPTGDGLPTTGGFSNLSITYRSDNTLPESLSFFGQQTDTYGYNDFGETTSYTYSLGGSYFMNYTRDKLGRITEVRESTGQGTETKTYSYDQTGRLTASTDSSGTTSYIYDSNSNITQVNSPNGIQVGIYDVQDRLTSFGDYSFTYNNHGELATKTKVSNNEVTSYTYDSFNNLKRVLLPSGKNIEYQVDGLNRRIRRTTDGGLSFESYFYKDQLNIASYEKTDGTQIRFFYGTKTHVPDAMAIGGSYYRIISDHLGSIREVRSQNGTLVQQLKYDAYGKVLLDTNPGFQPFGFAGGLYDHETGLVRFGARDYDGYTRRWLSKDPILFDGGSPNFYTYALNDPINLIDMNGLTPADVNRIRNTFRRTVDNMTRRGQRMDPGRLNNLLSYFPNSDLQVCHEQAQTLQDVLNGDPSLQDDWSFTREGQDFPPHYWVDAINNNNPRENMELDPWRNQIRYTPRR